MSDGTWTVRRLLEWTGPFFTRKDVDAPRLSAELLLAHVLGVPRIKLYTDYERAVPEAELLRYHELVRRAAEQEPVAYLTGRAQFFNLEFEVTRDVLIPRPDTEVLVENVIRVLRERGPAGWDAPRVLDLCTGSGCVAAAIAANVKGVRVWAGEISAAAMDVAKMNLHRLKLGDRVTCLEGDLYAPLDGISEPFHIIAANPPYITTAGLGELDKSVRDYEPMGALNGGADGLDIHRRIWSGAAGRLVADGEVMLEIAFDQGVAAMRALAEYSSLTGGRIIKDYGGRDRVVAARKTAT